MPHARSLSHSDKNRESTDSPGALSVIAVRRHCKGERVRTMKAWLGLVGYTKGSAPSGDSVLRLRVNFNLCYVVGAMHRHSANAFVVGNP